MNNNIIPACIIGAGLFAVALKPAPQPAPIPQAEPVAAASASATGPSEPVIVWYGTNELGRAEQNNGTASWSALYRGWSDGTIEMKIIRHAAPTGDACSSLSSCSWTVISSTQMACRTDVNGDGQIEFGDLLAVLSQFGGGTTCPDTVQLQCGLGLPTG